MQTAGINSTTIPPLSCLGCDSGGDWFRHKSEKRDVLSDHGENGYPYENSEDGNGINLARNNAKAAV